MDLNWESLTLVYGCVLHKLKRFLFYFLHFVIRSFEFLKKCIQSAEQQRQHTIKTIQASPSLSSFTLCVFIITFPITFLFIGLSISSYLSPNTYIFPSKDVVVDPSSLNYTHHNHNNLTIITAGRLGNQMFQYAALYGISTANGFKRVLAGSGELTKAFSKLECMVEKNEEQKTKMKSTWPVYVERRSNTFDGHTFTLNFMRNIQLVGFYQSWRYFDHARVEIRRQFASFRGASEVNDFVKVTLEEVEKTHPGEGEVVMVGVHVRRGDFTDTYNSQRGYSTPDKYYYRRAMQVFTRKHSRVVFMVCSDDQEWVKKHLPSTTHPTILSPFSSSPHQDLKLLASCHHTIMSGGSFGWWGAWMAEGTTIYPISFPTPNSPLASNFKLSDYYLPQWIGL